MKVRGPKGKFNYNRNLAPHLLMLAGGSGITPMYQIIQSSILDPLDKTEIDLIYANVNEDDIRGCGVRCGADRQFSARSSTRLPRSRTAVSVFT